MSVNRHQPHIFILPEDDANRQFAVGFVLNINVNSNQVHILTPARGWTHVLDDFASGHIDKMRQYQNRIMVLLMDFDDHVDDRLQKVKEAIPNDLTDRVFVLGARTEPEALKRDTSRTYEGIGLAMADDCRSGAHAIWGHDLLSHNEDELSRLGVAVCAWLFRV